MWFQAVPDDRPGRQHVVQRRQAEAPTPACAGERSSWRAHRWRPSTRTRAGPGRRPRGPLQRPDSQRGRAGSRAPRDRHPTGTFDPARPPVPGRSLPAAGAQSRLLPEASKRAFVAAPAATPRQLRSKRVTTRAFVSPKLAISVGAISNPSADMIRAHSHCSRPNRSCPRMLPTSPSGSLRIWVVGVAPCGRYHLPPCAAAPSSPGRRQSRSGSRLPRPAPAERPT